jgi:ABC-2 type transport system permease protein
MSRILRIAWREYISYVRTVGFWISLCAMPLLLYGVSILPGMMERTTPPPRLAIVDLSGQNLGPALKMALAEDEAGLRTKSIAVVDAPAEAVLAPNAAAAGAVLRRYLTTSRAAVGRPALDDAVVLSVKRGGVGLDLWTDNLSDQALESRLQAALAQVLRRQRLVEAGVSPGVLAAADRVQPTVAVYSPKAAQGGRVSLRDRLPSLTGFAMGFLLWSTVLTGAQILLVSVIEEKSTRILEVLLSSASAAEIMGGKILGAGGVTVSVLAAWGLIGAAIIAATAPAIGADLWAVLIGRGLMLYFALYLVGGYLMYASIFVSIGAFCETPRDAQTLLAPVMLTLMIPLIFMAQSIRHPDAPILAVLSWVPPFTPFLMIARVASSPSLFRIAGSLALMAATTAVVIWICGKAFRAGALSTGKVDFRVLFAKLMGRGAA